MEETENMYDQKHTAHVPMIRLCTHFGCVTYPQSWGRARWGADRVITWTDGGTVRRWSFPEVSRWRGQSEVLGGCGSWPVWSRDHVAENLVIANHPDNRSGWVVVADQEEADAYGDHLHREMYGWSLIEADRLVATGMTAAEAVAKLKK